MNLIQPWKIRRELWRVWLHIKVTAIRALGLKSTMRYAGLDIPLYREGISAEVVMGIATGLYEQPEIAGLSRVIRPGDRILELGAGLGVVTALLARAAGPEGRILAFEADTKLIKDTREFLDRHKVDTVELRNAVLVPQAVPGETRDFHVSRVFAVSSLLPRPGSKRHKTISVPAEAVNTVIGDFRPDVLICDIEGGEAELIPAIDASGLRAVVIEMHPKRISVETIAGLREMLERQGLIQDPTPLGGTVELFERAAPP
jgi:FkbM family methyltransferase